MADENPHTLPQQLAAEAIGCFFLYGGVIGSGIMADQLSGGNVAVALLGNTVSVGAILYVLIVMLAPISGAHFNPAVTFAFWLRKEISAAHSLIFIVAQLLGGLVGVFAVHLMFDMPILQAAVTERTGLGQWVGEIVATFGLLLTILLLIKHKAEAIPAAVGLYISSAIWFTSSTCFANPGITVIRALSDSFTGIAPVDVPMFVAMQFLGAGIAVWCAKALGAGADQLGE